jgi:hypothetical protein
LLAMMGIAPDIKAGAILADGQAGSAPAMKQTSSGLRRQHLSWWEYGRAE